MYKQQHRIWLIVLAVTCFLLTAVPLSSQAAKEQPAKVQQVITIIMGDPNFAVNGAYHDLEDGLLTRPIMEKDLFLSPLEDIIGTIGGTYNWSKATQKVTIELNGTTIELTVNQTKAKVNGKDTICEIAPQVKDGSLFLPARFVMERLGFTVTWEPKRTRLVMEGSVPVKKENAPLAKGGPVTIATMLNQSNEWYHSVEAQKVADNILGYQNPDGGWIKLQPDVNITQPVLGVGDLNAGKRKSTIDNDSTNMQIRFLGKLYTTTKAEKYLNGFNKGLDYLLNGQYDNGGWSQFFPEGAGYQRNITINDNAMANVLDLLRDVLNKDEGLAFVDAPRINRCQTAYQKGIDMLLRTQIVVNGKKTAWCQQYDQNTLEPTIGRAYELPSLSSQESAKVVRFLMSIDNPNPEIIDAVQSAVAWLNATKLSGIKVITQKDPTLEFGSDRIVVKDPKASPIWARFYDIDTNKPLFSSRDSQKRTEFWQVSYERRNKYNWYVTEPLALLTQDYPTWQKKWALENILK